MASSDVAPLPIGIILYGYRIDRVLGQGGFGVTYLGTKVDTQKVYVIKENIPGSSARRRAGELQFSWPDGAENAEGTGGRKWAEANFIREAQRLSQLKHRGIVSATEAFRSSETGTVYYAMPYVSSTSLSQLLRQNVVCTKEWVLYLLAALLDSLKYVHSQNILHRDIKPENILIAPDGEPVMIDFGSARGTDADHKTRIISANYSPIEQMRGQGEGPWTDIYSLAASMYQVLTGEYVPQLACRGGKKDAYVPLASRADLAARFGAPLLHSLDRALAYEPEDRYQSTTEWINALKADPAFQFAVPVAAMSAPQDGPSILVGDYVDLSEPKKSKRGLIALLVSLIVVLLCLIGGVLWWLFNQSNEGGATQPPAKTAKHIEPAKLQVIPEDDGVPGGGGGGETDGKEQDTAERTLRIIARPDITLYDAQTHAPLATEIPAFAVYYSRGEKDGYYEVAERPESKTIGVLKKEDVRPWPYNLVIDFNSIGGVIKRDRALFFNRADKAESFITERDGAERHALVERAEARVKGTADDDLEDTHGVVAIEPKQWGNAHKLLPVIDYVRDSEGNMAELPYNGAVGDNQSSVLKICAMTQRVNQTTVAPVQTEQKKPLVDVVYVVDTSRSMGPYIADVRRFIADHANSLNADTEGRMRFGLVAYRDWKYNADGQPDTTLCEYVVKNYNQSLGRMMNLDEFKSEVLEARAADGDYDLRETRVDSVDCAEDVLAGLREAVENMPWRDKGKDKAEGCLRFVVLVGDAPGRETRVRETDGLRLNSPYWAQRAVGSLPRTPGEGSIDIDGMKELMKNEHVFLESYFLVTPPPHGVDQTYEKYWINYLKDGISQFRRLSHSDVSDDPQKSCCMVVEAYNLQNAVDKGSILSRLRVEAAPSFKQAFAENMSELATLTGRGVDVDSTDENASAAKSLFTAAYVDWFSKQPPSADEKNDMEGWTQDTNDQRGRTLEAKIVLSRAQLEQLVQNLQNVLDGVKNQKDTDIDAAANELTALMYTLISDPNVKLADGSDTTQLIGTLPFKSNLLIAAENDTLNSASAGAELLNELEARKQYLSGRLSLAGECIPDPKGDRKKDLFLVPIHMLP